MKRGFSLIEIMLVLILISALSVIAYPLYNEHLVRVRRVRMIATLCEVANRLEDYHLQHQTYDGAKVESFTMGRVWYQDFYNLSLKLNGDFYILQATPFGKQAEDDCGVLLIDQDGKRTADGNNGTQCWL